MGGLTIIQAKHYKNVMGVNHIPRAGGCHGGEKGRPRHSGHHLLVYHRRVAEADEHGRMELIDGPRLVYLIKEHLGKDVLIGIKRPRNVATGPPRRP